MYREKDKSEMHWLYQFLLNASADEATDCHEPHYVKVLRDVAGPFQDGSVRKQVTDGELYMDALFNLSAVSSGILCEDSQLDWNSSKLLLKKYRIRYETAATNQKMPGQVVLVVSECNLVSVNDGFTLKETPSFCMTRPELQTRFQSYCQKLQPTEGSSITESSLGLALLLAQMSEDGTAQTDLLPTHEVGWFTTFTRPLDLENFLISAEDQQRLDGIEEWLSDYFPVEEASTQSSTDNPGVAVQADLSSEVNCQMEPLPTNFPKMLCDASVQVTLPLHYDQRTRPVLVDVAVEVGSSLMFNTQQVGNSLMFNTQQSVEDQPRASNESEASYGPAPVPCSAPVLLPNTQDFSPPEEALSSSNSVLLSCDEAPNNLRPDPNLEMLGQRLPLTDSSGNMTQEDDSVVGILASKIATQPSSQALIVSAPASTQVHTTESTGDPVTAGILHGSDPERLDPITGSGVDIRVIQSTQIGYLSSQHCPIEPDFPLSPVLCSEEIEDSPQPLKRFSFKTAPVNRDKSVTCDGSFSCLENVSRMGADLNGRNIRTGLNVHCSGNIPNTENVPISANVANEGNVSSKANVVIAGGSGLTTEIVPIDGNAHGISNSSSEGFRVGTKVPTHGNVHSSASGRNDFSGGMIPNDNKTTSSNGLANWSSLPECCFFFSAPYETGAEKCQNKDDSGSTKALECVSEAGVQLEEVPLGRVVGCVWISPPKHPGQEAGERKIGESKASVKIGEKASESKTGGSKAIEKICGNRTGGIKTGKDEKTDCVKKGGEKTRNIRTADARIGSVRTEEGRINDGRTELNVPLCCNQTTDTHELVPSSMSVSYHLNPARVSVSDQLAPTTASTSSRLDDACVSAHDRLASADMLVSSRLTPDSMPVFNQLMPARVSISNLLSTARVSISDQLGPVGASVDNQLANSYLPVSQQLIPASMSVSDQMTPASVAVSHQTVDVSTVTRPVQQMLNFRLGVLSDPRTFAPDSMAHANTTLPFSLACSTVSVSLPVACTGTLLAVTDNHADCKTKASGRLELVIHDSGTAPCISQLGCVGTHPRVTSKPAESEEMEMDSFDELLLKSAESTKLCVELESSGESSWHNTVDPVTNSACKTQLTNSMQEKAAGKNNEVKTSDERQRHGAKKKQKSLNGAKGGKLLRSRTRDPMVLFAKHDGKKLLFSHKRKLFNTDQMLETVASGSETPESRSDAGLGRSEKSSKNLCCEPDEKKFKSDSGKKSKTNERRKRSDLIGNIVVGSSNTESELARTQAVCAADVVKQATHGQNALSHGKGKESDCSGEKQTKKSKIGAVRILNSDLAGKGISKDVGPERKRRHRSGLQKTEQVLQAIAGRDENTVGVNDVQADLSVFNFSEDDDKRTGTVQSDSNINCKPPKDLGQKMAMERQRLGKSLQKRKRRSSIDKFTGMTKDPSFQGTSKGTTNLRSTFNRVSVGAVSCDGSTSWPCDRDIGTCVGVNIFTMSHNTSLAQSNKYSERSVHKRNVASRDVVKDTTSHNLETVENSGSRDGSTHRPASASERLSNLGELQVSIPERLTLPTPKNSLPSHQPPKLSIPRDGDVPSPVSSASLSPKINVDRIKMLLDRDKPTSDESRVFSCFDFPENLKSWTYNYFKNWS